MIKIGSALAEIATHRPQNFYVDSQNLYALGVHGDFHLDMCLATWTRGHVADSKSPDTSSTYICPDPRRKVSSSSDQYWPRAVACNVAMIKSAKSELNWLTNKINVNRPKKIPALARQPPILEFNATFAGGQSNQSLNFNKILNIRANISREKKLAGSEQC